MFCSYAVLAAEKPGYPLGCNHGFPLLKLAGRTAEPIAGLVLEAGPAWRRHLELKQPLREPHLWARQAMRKTTKEGGERFCPTRCWLAQLQRSSLFSRVTRFHVFGGRSGRGTHSPTPRPSSAQLASGQQRKPSKTRPDFHSCQLPQKLPQNYVELRKPALGGASVGSFRSFGSTLPPKHLKASVPEGHTSGCLKRDEVAAKSAPVHLLISGKCTSYNRNNGIPNQSCVSSLVLPAKHAFPIHTLFHSKQVTSENMAWAGFACLVSEKKNKLR